MRPSSCASIANWAALVCLVDRINVWGGYTDQESEGVFYDVNTGEPLRESDFQPWFFGEPNGERKENCQIIWLSRAWSQLCVGA